MEDPIAEQVIDEVLQPGVLPHSAEQDCPYLPDRQARQRGFWADVLHPELYQVLLDRCFRRSGQTFYQPDCPQCQECTQTRVPVQRFKPSKSQRRIWRKNEDLRVTAEKPSFTEHKWQMFDAYQMHQHGQRMLPTSEDLYTFLYHSPVPTIEFSYRLEDALVGISIADQTPGSLSSVYMYFDPQQARRRLGTYSILWEIDYCRRQALEMYYLGFYIEGCGKMEYKADFAPQQRLARDFEWIDHP